MTRRSKQRRMYPREGNQRNESAAKKASQDESWQLMLYKPNLKGQRQIKLRTETGIFLFGESSFKQDTDFL